MNQSKRLILASNSPRRQQLLSEAGYLFEVQPSNIDESYPAEMEAFEVPRNLALKKAVFVANQLDPESVVLAADTIVHCESQILNKPVDEKEAFDMLRLLSGNWHEVVTGVALANDKRVDSFIDVSKVKFKSLSDQDIGFYIKNYKPFDKAGAYGAQDWIGLIGVERIEGSYFNVMGLPMHTLFDHLKAFGILPKGY